MGGRRGRWPRVAPGSPSLSPACSPGLCWHPSRPRGRQDPRVRAPRPLCTVDTALSGLPTEAHGLLKPQRRAVVRPFPEAHGLFEPPCGPLRGLPCLCPDGGASGQCEGPSPALPQLSPRSQLCPRPLSPPPSVLCLGACGPGPGLYEELPGRCCVAAPVRTLSADLRGGGRRSLCFVNARQGAPHQVQATLGCQAAGLCLAYPCHGSASSLSLGELAGPALLWGTERWVCVQV